MNTRKISVNEWRGFCDSFSREHHGWLVSVAVTDPNGNDIGKPLSAKVLAQNLPLQEIREAQSEDDAEIMITVGEGSDEISFLIEHVAAIYENSDKKNNAQKDIGMRIDSTDNTSTEVQFRTPAEPGGMEGLTQPEL
jgi:hypothetical protein